MKILIVDDERIQRETLSAILDELQHETFVGGSISEGVAALEATTFDLILTDFKMPDGNGIELARFAARIMPQTPVIIMTAFADVSSVIEAMNAGVVDYLLKPLNVDQLIRKISALSEVKALWREVRDLRKKTNQPLQSTLLGDSPSIKKVRATIDLVAQTKGTVFITGESGTGKEVAARLIHASSPEFEERFVAVNCAAIPENLLESELFGHKKGSFTGAVTDKDGLFKVANGGTIFLDEIGDLPKNLQAKLLRVLQEREITPVGATKPIRIDVRLIAATNRNLSADVASGMFRQDLFYRINVVEIRMPSLREHPGDISILAQFFIDKYVKEFGRRAVTISNLAARMLMTYSWPGNVRELENVMERAIILGVKDGVLEPTDLPPAIVGNEVGDTGTNSDGQLLELGFALDEFARQHIEKVLSMTGYDKKEAAKILGLGLSSLYRKMDDLEISRKLSEMGA